MRSLGKTLLAFALVHAVLQGQICLLLQVVMSAFFYLFLTFCLAFVFYLFTFKISLVQLLSRVRLFATPLTAPCQASLSITNYQSPVCQFGDAIQPSHPLSFPFPPALNLS